MAVPAYRPPSRALRPAVDVDSACLMLTACRCLPRFTTRTKREGALGLAHVSLTRATPHPKLPRRGCHGPGASALWLDLHLNTLKCGATSLSVYTTRACVVPTFPPCVLHHHAKSIVFCTTQAAAGCSARCVKPHALRPATCAVTCLANASPAPTNAPLASRNLLSVKVTTPAS